MWQNGGLGIPRLLEWVELEKQQVRVHRTHSRRISTETMRGTPSRADGRWHTGATHA